MTSRFVKPAFVEKPPCWIEMNFNPSRQLLGGRHSESDYEMVDGNPRKTMGSANHL